MPRDLEGRVAVVTGAESGIGAACCRALAQAGAILGICYFQDRLSAEKTRDAVLSAGSQAVTVQTDVGDELQVKAAFANVVADLGRPDLLINSAGLNMSGIAVADMELEQWDRLIRTDLTGAFLTSRELVRGLRAAGKSGRIINISSIHGQAVRAGGADYCAAKAGLENLTRVMALECADMGITVNAIAPGMILTPMNQRAEVDSEYRQQLEQHIPIKRAGTPEEVARMAIYLCSEAAAYVTGTVLTIDGGLSLEAALGA